MDTRMNAGTWIALAGLAVTALGGLGWLGALTWHGGRQSQRIDTAISDIKQMRRTQDEHGTAIAGWSHVAAMLEEVRADMKAYMMRPVRRNGAGN